MTVSNVLQGYISQIFELLGNRVHNKYRIYYVLCRYNVEIFNVYTVLRRIRFIAGKQDMLQ